MFFSLRRSLTHTHLEPLTYLLYNHQGLRMKYVLGCDTLIYHSILFTPSMYFEQDSGERYARHLAPEVPILSQRILLSGFESGIHDKLWHRSTPYCLRTVYVSWVGLWVAVRTAPGTRSAYTIPKDPTTRVWIWNTWQAVTYKYTILYTL